MTIIARYTPRDLPVEITNVFHTSDGRKIVFIHTIDGSTPFTSWTDGGWAESDQASVSQDSLTDIHQELPHQNGKIVGNYTPQEIERYRSLFPSRYNPNRQPKLSGINND